MASIRPLGGRRSSNSTALIRTLSGLNCRLWGESSLFALKHLPPDYLHCETLLKPDVISFGEPIPKEAYALAHYEAQSCDLVVVIGTAAAIPKVEKTYGATVVEINLKRTSLTHHVWDYAIWGPCATATAEIIKREKERKE